MKSYFKPDRLTQREKDKMCSEVRVRDRYCQKCGVWCLAGGEVSHKKTVGAHGDTAWRLDNMELLCWVCHRIKWHGPKWSKGER